VLAGVPDMGAIRITLGLLSERIGGLLQKETELFVVSYHRQYETQDKHVLRLPLGRPNMLFTDA
jgi:hypothetical protein